jgi:hypothetical protein
MSAIDPAIRTEPSVLLNRPTAGQDGYLMRAVVNEGDEEGNVEFVTAAAAGLSIGKHHCGFYVPQVWSGSPAAPAVRYNQPTINTIVSLDAPKANRVAWYTSRFSLGAGNTGPFIYTGPSTAYRFDWQYSFQIINANPNLAVLFGIRFPGQTVPKGSQQVVVNGSVGDRFYASGGLTGVLVSGTQIWLGARPYNGTVAADRVGAQSALLVVREVGTDLSIET